MYREMDSRRRRVVIWCCILIIAGGELNTGGGGGAAASESIYTVGDVLGGWVVPPDVNYYQRWADKQHFDIGDSFNFTWIGDDHTVAQLVYKSDYDNCNPLTTITVGDIVSNPITITINSTGPNYFICTSHCSSGQKVTITTGNPASAASPIGKSAASSIPYVSLTFCLGIGIFFLQYVLFV